MHPLRKLANCSKMRMAIVIWAEFKPRLRGSSEPSPNQRRTASCCPSAGSLDSVPSPAPACWPLRVGECRHGAWTQGHYTPEPELMRQPSGCLERSGPRMWPPRLAMKTCKKFFAKRFSLVLVLFCFQMTLKPPGLMTLKNARLEADIWGWKTGLALEWGSEGWGCI